MIILLPSAKDVHISCNVKELEKTTEKACSRHQLLHRSKNTRCFINCVITAIDHALVDKEPSDARFQCDVCRLIFDTYASAYLHIC